jgi:DNA-binding NarL/FixJ family response regulator
MKVLRMLLADDHAIVLEGLRHILEPEFEIVGEVADGRALVSVALIFRPEIIITAISLPRLNGIEAAREIRKINRKVKIIFLTMHADPIYALEALDAEGSAYILKNTPVAEILLAIREPSTGESMCHHRSTRKWCESGWNGPAGETRLKRGSRRARGRYSGYSPRGRASRKLRRC